MRVELRGDLLVEPNSLRQLPLNTSSNCSNHHQCRNDIQFSELSQIEVPIIGKNSLDPRERRSVFGFTFSEEEWSQFNKSHFADLEPYERKKMCSLPKSFTPFSSTVRDGGLECDKNLNRSASNSILLRKCESLSPTPSQFLLNGGEPNNNNITHPSSLSQMLLLHKSHEGFQEDEKENWLSDEGWDKKDPPLPSEDAECQSTLESIPSGGVFGNERPFLWEAIYPVTQDDDKVGEIEMEFLPSARFPFTHSSTAVGTIGSHPNPIISCAEDQTHFHHHHDFSTSQQASFPASIYNFNSVDPLLLAECYDDWNANVASLCENNSNTTPVIYPDAHANNPNGFAFHSAAKMPDAGLGHDGCVTLGESGDANIGNGLSGRAIEEVNTLSTFLSKFDDKVAAIWGEQGNTRSALGSNYLSVDGCISTASTPLGSSNPWGSPSSDISSTNISDFRQVQLQQQSMNQVSLAADALLSAGYGIPLNHDAYQFELQSTTQNQGDRVSMSDLTVSPPKGNYNIMHSMKQYFGSAPPEGEYHIIKRTEVNSSAEELEKSLAVLNHSGESAGFVVCPKASETGKHTDIDMNAMARALDSIDLDNEADEEWEIVEACNKGKSQGYDGEDLLNSWKTHFRTVDQVEAVASARGIDLLESPITSINSHQINPNLPEYRLFDVNVDGDYHVFHRSGETIFPVKYKVFHQNEKANQTDDLGVDISSPMDASASRMLHAYKMTSDWSKCLPIPAFEFSQDAIGTLPRSTTPVPTYDCDNADLQSADWCNLSKGVDYNGMWSEWALGDETSTSLFPTTGEYCDSGVDGVGSRSDFYDDMFADYEGDYENFSGMGFAFPGFTVANETDTDYGQFQDATSLSGCDSSSLSGKHVKSNKRSKARLRPCKYFFLEGSCRRGNDCKFSHDSITCRYWAEGSCLKGQNCPYVHCFIDGKKIMNQDEEYGIRATEAEKQYHLESETDFPALCSTKSTMLSSRQPMALGFGSAAGDGIRRLEDSLESLTVFTDSNSSVVEEEVAEPRRLFLFERLRASSPNKTTEKVYVKKPICDTGHKSAKQSGTYRVSDQQEWSETGASSRSLSKSKSLGDTNSAAPWVRHSVSRSNSHTYASSTGTSVGFPVKEKRKKKKH